MLSLAALLAVLSYASPASAEIKFSGDASVRLRGAFENYKESADYMSDYEDKTDDLNFAFRYRLKASADIGSGYFFKAMVTSDNYAGGWLTVTGNEDDAELNVSQIYFGRMMENSHYMMGRLPLNSINNPIFDLAFAPFSPVDIPVATYQMDRLFGFNYGTKIGDGELNATLCVLDNDVKDNKNGSGDTNGDGLFNDGYVLHLGYKTNIGNVTVEPQALLTLTQADGVYENSEPQTFGANVTIPTGDAKIGLSAFYTVCKDKNASDYGNNVEVDYSGYLLRLKGEVGGFTGWIDYNHATDKTYSYSDETHENLFIWAQYKYNVYESAMGTFSLTPTIRYWAVGSYEEKDWFNYKEDYSRLRTELVATVSF